MGRPAIAAALATLLAHAAEAQQAPPQQWAEYEANVPKTILELQPFRAAETATAADGGALRLVALNPAINAWFLLEAGGDAHHLENPDPAGQRVSLTPGPPAALALSGPSCAPWEGAPSELEQARKTGLPFAPVCDGRLYLRNRVAGARTNLERITDFLRDRVWKGEKVVGFVRDTLFRDAYRATGREAGGGGRAAAGGPPPARIDPAQAGKAVWPEALSLGVVGAAGGMTLGDWYAIADLPGIYASAIRPGAIAAEVLRGPGQTNALDGVEAGALAYMVAFDLSRFDLGFALGTDHPRLDWSPRPAASARTRGLPGPDGVKDARPLATTGMVPPSLVPRTVATFTGGFKRRHGAFKFGDLSTVNAGSHYGFVEQGAILSKLQPSLSTIYVLDDGTVEMKTWTRADDSLLPRLRHARQNGVPLLETAPDGTGVPGGLVTNWGRGNWSGSADRKLRTLRAGGCMIEDRGRRFLVYGYFSTATPSAMARTFQAYGCRYAMLLDMNALEHTYLALYTPREGRMHVSHLVEGMSLVEKKDRGGGLVPRFIGFPDNRDLFYVMRKEGAR